MAASLFEYLYKCKLRFGLRKTKGIIKYYFFICCTFDDSNIYHLGITTPSNPRWLPPFACWMQGKLKWYYLSEVMWGKELIFVALSTIQTYHLGITPSNPRWLPPFAFWTQYIHWNVNYYVWRLKWYRLPNIKVEFLISLFFMVRYWNFIPWFPIQKIA